MPLLVFLVLSLLHQVRPGHVPEIPAGRRAQYYVIQGNNGYRYGYDTGDGIAVKQEGDASNEVSGSYSYGSPSGNKLELRYTAGVRGFVPEVLGNTPQGPGVNYAPGVGYSATPPDSQQNQLNPDGSYSFSYSTGDSSRQESSDSRNNVQGRYSYTNQAGTHDLNYVAGAQTGFLPTGGSLAQPNGLGGPGVPPAQIRTAPGSDEDGSYSSTDETDVQANTGDASYSFSIDTDEYKRQESSDSAGNIRGTYTYKNSAGTHDLSFVAGSATGFQPTGGTLSVPPGLTEAQLRAGDSGGSTGSTGLGDEAGSGDASYSFTINTADYQRQESSDSGGNVRGSYSYQNSAGNHDLSFIAGSATGFQPTGGSLKTPPGLTEGQLQQSDGLAKTYLPPSKSPPATSLNNIASYTAGKNLGVKLFLPPSPIKVGYIF